MKALMFPRFHLASPPALGRWTGRSFYLFRQVCGIAYYIGFGMRLKRGFHQALVRLLSTTIVGVLSVTPLPTTLLSQCLGIRMRTRANLVKTKAFLRATKQQLPELSDHPR